MNAATPLRRDVIILGTGIAGTILGAILGRLGVDVLMLERGTHPRFTIGEATTPETSMWLRILSSRYGIPEIEHIGPFQSVVKHVSTTTGIKRHFGFVYHQPGQEQRPQDATMSIIPDFPFGPESHLMRAEIDAYMLHAAIKHGAHYRSGVNVKRVVEHDDGMTVEAEGETFHARFVVDAGGGASLIAASFGLRETPTRFKTHSRSMFTHMIGVKPYDLVAPPPGRHQMPRWWASGTLHHIVDGGWMWVIPFDNHPWSTNPLCSVGLMLDPRVHPPTKLSPDEDFRAFLARYPTVARQFADARPVRDWARTNRLQYSSTRSSGARWFMLAHAYAFVDPLFSRGITNTMETIHSLVPRLCSALREDDFSVDRLADLEVQQRDMFDNNDELVRHSYMAFRSFDLWNAWNRVWTLGIFYGGARLVRAYNWFKADGDPTHLDRLDTPHLARTLAPTLPTFEPVFQRATQLVQDAAEGRVHADDAARQIIGLLKGVAISPPALRLDDPDAICTDFRLGTLVKIMQWANSEAPQEVRDQFFDFPRRNGLGEFVARLRSPQLLLGKGRLHVPEATASALDPRLLTPELSLHG